MLFCCRRRRGRRGDGVMGEAGEEYTWVLEAFRLYHTISEFNHLGCRVKTMKQSRPRGALPILSQIPRVFY